MHFCGIKVLVVVALATAVTSRQYKVRDDDEGNREYGDYYGDESQGSDQDEKSSAGFVEPLDFSSFFSSGFGGSASGSGKIDSFFKPQGSDFSLGIGSAFPAELQASASTKNGTGFISPSVNFPSLFDSAASASTAGFRPQDFLKRSSNTDEDGIGLESTPLDFFSSTFSEVNDDFAPTKAYFSKQIHPGKSSYPASVKYPTKATLSGPTPAPQPYYGSPASTKPQTTYSPLLTTPASSLPYDGYPTKSASTYNPTGPYLSKSAYKTADKTAYKAYPVPTYGSKSVYPKKASSDLYSTKIGQRPTVSSSFRPTPAQSQLSPLYKYTATVPENGKGRYIAPRDYYKFGPSEEDEEEAESRTEFSPFVTARASTLDKKFLAPSSNPYTPSEYGKELDITVSEPEENEEAQINPAQDKKNCKKIDKKLSKEAFTHGRFRRDAMTCYACNNPKTGGSFEKCLYDSYPEGSNQQFFHGHAMVYSDKPMKHRRRRDVAFDVEFDNAYSDGKLDSLFSFTEPLVRVARQQPASNYGKNSYDDYISRYASPSKKQFQYEPEHYAPVEYDDAEYKQAPTNNADQSCETVTKGTMTCSVCKNAKTGGQSEQCSYATTPKENNYFVARQSSYNSKKPRKTEGRQSRQEPRSGNFGTDAPAETYHTRKTIKPYDFSTETAAAVTSKGSYKGPLKNSPSRYTKRRSDEEESHDYDGDAEPRPYSTGGDGPANNYNSYDYPADRRSDETKQKPKNYNGEASSKHYGGDGPGNYYTGYDQPADRRSDESKQAPKNLYGNSKSYDEYFRELFPELAGQESKNARSDNTENSEEYFEDASQPKAETPTTVDYYKSLPEYHYPDIEQKKDLEKVLGEFSQKDRSACKKVVRDKMTCYQCLDKKGLQHEECMFVAASQPKSQHLAYHELKEIRLVPDGKASASQPSNTTARDSESAHSTDTEQTASTTTAVPSDVTTKRRRIVSKKAKTTTTTTTTTTTKRPSLTKTTTLADKPIRRASRYVKTMTSTTTVKVPTRRQTKRPEDALTAGSERREQQAPPEEEEESEEREPETTYARGDPRGSPKRYEYEEPQPKHGEFEVDTEGLYTAETKEVFDPVLKTYLPQYMLTRSEHEEIFDEVMKSGR